MQALAAVAQAPAGVTFGNAAGSRPKPDEVLAEIELFPVVARNPDHARTLPAGRVPVFDAVGVVVQSSALLSPGVSPR